MYAISFGNHLSMILLLVPFTLFLIAVHPNPRELFRPSTIGLATVIAIAARTVMMLMTRGVRVSPRPRRAPALTDQMAQKGRLRLMA